MSDQPSEREGLYDVLLSQAASALEKSDEMLPLGITVSLDGSHNVRIGAGFDTNRAALEALLRGFREQAGAREIRTAAVCFAATANMPGESVPSDIVVIIIEGNSGPPIRIHRPY